MLILFSACRTVFPFDSGVFLPGVPEMLANLRQKGFMTGLWAFELPHKIDRDSIFPNFTDGYLGTKSNERLQKLSQTYDGNIVLVDYDPKHLRHNVREARKFPVIAAGWGTSANFQPFYTELENKCRPSQGETS